MAALWRRLSNSLAGRLEALLLLIWVSLTLSQWWCHKTAHSPSREPNEQQVFTITRRIRAYLMEKNTWMSIRPIDLRKVAVLSQVGHYTSKTLLNIRYSDCRAVTLWQCRVALDRFDIHRFKLIHHEIIRKKVRWGYWICFANVQRSEHFCSPLLSAVIERVLRLLKVDTPKLKWFERREKTQDFCDIVAEFL